MKLRKIMAAVLAAVMLLSFAGCGSKEGAVYVQSVAELAMLGGIAPVTGSRASWSLKMWLRSRRTAKRPSRSCW